MRPIDGPARAGGTRSGATRAGASRAGGLLLVAGLLAGCGFFREGAGEPDRLATWSSQPLPPDPSITALALGENGPCRMDDPTDNIVGPMPQVLLQDRRMTNIAAFLVATPANFGSCIVARTGSSGGGYGPPLKPMSGPLSIDDQGSGTVADGAARQLGGRVAIPGAQVVVLLDDDREVVASMGNGFWLTWWPADHAAVKVIARDASGEVASLAVVAP